MDIKDLVLLGILAVGGLVINWNIIKRDIFHTKENIIDSDSSNKLHIKTRKRVKKKAS